MKSIICLGFADFSKLLVFTSIIVVDIYVGYIAFTFFLSNFWLVNCWILNFRISKPVKKNALSSVVSIRFYSLWYYYSNNIQGNFLTVSSQSMQLLFQLEKSRTQNALRIPLNSDVIFFSVILTFITKKTSNRCFR